MGLTNGLAAFWSLNESSSGARFDELGVSHLSETNGVTRVDGKVGYGAHFQKSLTQTLQVADNTALSLGTDSAFTLAGWVNFDSMEASPNPNRAMIGKWANIAAIENIEYLFRIENTFLQLFVGNNSSPTQGVGWEFIQSTDVLTTGTWYFVLAFHDPVTNVIGIQINNGTAQTVAWSGGTFDGSGATFLGDVITPGTNALDGILDQWGVWKRLLSADEKTFLYNGGAGRQFGEIRTALSAPPGSWVGQWPTVVRSGSR